MMSIYRWVRAAMGTACALLAALPTNAAPYASRVSVTGGIDVSFILNEPADSLAYRINGGPLQSLDGSTAGAKAFSLSTPTDTFDIVAKKSDPLGYTIPTGDVIASAPLGLSQATAASGLRLISDDSNLLNRFNSPRGVGVGTNPQAANFGITYVSNSAVGTVAGRVLGDGLYALNADQTDAFGYGDSASNPVLMDGFPAFITVSASSPYRLFVADDGQVYATDWSDANGNLFQFSADLANAVNVFEGFGGSSQLPPGQNHGSIAAAYVEGSLTTGDLAVYTIDEDLTSAHLGGSSSTDTNSLWRYDLSGYVPSGVTPTRLNDSLLPLVNADLDRGADGKFYLSQQRTAGEQAGLFVLDSNGTEVYSSLTASRALLGDPSAVDILRNIMGIAVSPDQRWLAGMLNNSDIVVVPLISGFPDLANRLLVSTGPDINSGRDVAFDAAGNLHYVSSGQAIYRVLSPGGDTFSMTSFDGQSFSFFVSSIPEPSGLALVVCGALATVRLRRKR